MLVIVQSPRNNSGDLTSHRFPRPEGLVQCEFTLLNTYKMFSKKLVREPRLRARHILRFIGHPTVSEYSRKPFYVG